MKDRILVQPTKKQRHEAGREQVLSPYARFRTHSSLIIRNEGGVLVTILNTDRVFGIEYALVTEKVIAVATHSGLK